MRILVVDDHGLIREALRGVLQELNPASVVMEAADSQQALALITEHSDLALILLDLNLPDRDGFSLLAELRESYPAISIVVLSASQERANVLKALDLGALGYIPKSAARQVMLGALRLILAGGIYIPTEVLMRGEEAPPAGAAPRQNNDAPRVSPEELGLTGRQLEVLALMMQGKSNKAICRILNLAEPTVKNHVTAILKSLKVTNRTEAVVAVNELGWDLPPAAKA
jgi:DNA-binding NarL/FixJ family response regulator